MKFGDTQLATGTAFLVQTYTGFGLVTALHNLTGRHPETGDCLHSQGGVPDCIEVFHNGLELGCNVLKTEPLLDDNGQPLWIEHPILKSACDVALLPLFDLDDVTVASYTRQESYPDIAVKIAEQISVVGFPMSQTAGGMMAIWCTGYIASEPDLDYAEKPKFLIDCRTRAGQSGSPVIAYRYGGYQSQNGGGVISPGSQAFRPLGVYTGRIHSEADIGVVWKWSVVEELMTQLDIRISRKVSEAMKNAGGDSTKFEEELAKLNLKLDRGSKP